MRLDLLITILLLQGLSSSGEQTFLSYREGEGEVYNPRYNVGKYYVTKPTELTTVEKGIWGYPQTTSQAKDGYLACGLGVEVQKPQGDKDDASIVQVSIIYCGLINWYESYPDKLNNFDEKDTIQKSIRCDPDKYVWAITTQFQPAQGPGIDDTALNGIWFSCRSISLDKNKVGWNLHSDKGNWGNMVGENEKFVCAARVTYEDDKKTNDRTGVNGLDVGLCKVIREVDEYS